VTDNQVPTLDRAMYQRTARAVLTHPLITETYPDTQTLSLVRRWAVPLRTDLARLFDYRLELTPTTARLFRVHDALDASQPAMAGPNEDRPFDRRRYACLALAVAAAEVSDSAGVRVLPALSGLGAPWWQPGAHGVIAGLHAGVRPGHVARAALEAIAWRVADIVDAMAEVAPVESLRVDGGLTNDETLLRIQADALDVPLIVNRSDVTVLGAAMLAGVGAGVFASVEAAAELLPEGRRVSASGDPGERERARERWREFVAASARL